MRSDDRAVVLDGSRLPDKELIGAKAWGIARMRQLGLPVPPAFALTTELCRQYHQAGRCLPDDLKQRVGEGIALLEAETGRTFGRGPRPLLVSVRSGAAVSMPGMMDTVLNLGMNDEVEAALAAETANPAYAHDTYRRFVHQYAKTVLKTPLYPPEGASPGELRALAEQESGRPVPADPSEQLWAAIAIVFDSWQSPRARAYRRHWSLSDEGGTAVTVQAMVFGNLDDRSGTGVLFTRNPLTGDKEPYGEYLPRGQGEDVVSGEHTPDPLETIDTQVPGAYEELIAAGQTLEREGRDAQDIEFTIERGRLYLLQSRTAKRSPQAAARMAVELAREGVLTPAEAVRRVTPEQVRSILRPRLSDAARASARLLVKGEAACPGVATGRVVLDPDEAEAAAAEGEQVVLARPTTSPEDVHGMIAAQAVVTEQGGSTSHAAVVSRALGCPCVVGCGERTLATLAGQQVTVDGTRGEVFEGVLATERTIEADNPYLRQLAEWAGREAPLAVYTPQEAYPGDAVDLDALAADAVGAEEIGRLPALLQGARGARGRVLESDAGVHAAVAAGLEYLVVETRLPALLSSLTVPVGRDSGDRRRGAGRPRG
ncbi:MAG TPA: pyruvate, phosphate dikinase [Actinomycetes bacterium]